MIATQWQEDSKVKFSQVEMDTHDLADLFIDVHARRVAPARASRSAVPRDPPELAAQPDTFFGLACP